MALTRKFLSAMGIDSDKIDEIIAAHAETVDALKEQINGYKDTDGKLTEAQQKVDTLTKELEKLKTASGDAAKVQAEFDAYKADVENGKANAAKIAALKSVLKTNGVNRDEFAELLLGKVDITKVEMQDGKITNADALIKPLKENFGGCFGTVAEHGTDTHNPPTGGNQNDESAMSDAEFYAKRFAKTE